MHTRLCMCYVQTLNWVFGILAHWRRKLPLRRGRIFQLVASFQLPIVTLIKVFFIYLWSLLIWWTISQKPTMVVRRHYSIMGWNKKIIHSSHCIYMWSFQPIQISDYEFGWLCGSLKLEMNKKSLIYIGWKDCMIQRKE